MLTERNSLCQIHGVTELAWRHRVTKDIQSNFRHLNTWRDAFRQQKAYLIFNASHNMIEFGNLVTVNFNKISVLTWYHKDEWPLQTSKDNF